MPVFSLWLLYAMETILRAPHRREDVTFLPSEGEVVHEMDKMRETSIISGHRRESCLSEEALGYVASHPGPQLHSFYTADDNPAGKFTNVCIQIVICPVRACPFCLPLPPLASASDNHGMSPLIAIQISVQKSSFTIYARCFNVLTHVLSSQWHIHEDFNFNNMLTLFFC